jgi:hypothetical protein
MSEVAGQMLCGQLRYRYAVLTQPPAEIGNQLQRISDRSLRVALFVHLLGKDINLRAQYSIVHALERARILVQRFHHDLLSPGRHAPERRSNYADSAAAKRLTSSTVFLGLGIVRDSA